MADFVRRGPAHEYIGESGDTKPGPIVAVSTLAEALDDSETGVDVADGALFQATETIIIESEEMRVESIAANTLTVTRAVNGTVPAAHANGLSLSRKQIIPIGSLCFERDTRQWYISHDGGTTWTACKREVTDG